MEIKITVNADSVEKFIKDLEYFKQDKLSDLTDEIIIEAYNKTIKRFYNDF